MKLTSEAREYCLEVLVTRGRESLVADLEGIGIACYDEEGVEELAEAALDSVEAGDIDFDWTNPIGQSGYIRKLWLAIDEVWGE